MGLDTSHDCWHGSYSGFAEWRKWLASFIGIELDNMEGFGGEIPWSTVKDPLKILLNHSDCDGHISPTNAGRLARRMYKLIEENGFDPEDLLKNYVPDLWRWRRVAQFASGCELAYSRKERVEFR